MFESRKRTVLTEKMLGPGGDLEFHAEGRAPCVLAIHGFTGTASELLPLAQRLAERGFAVDAPLLPGHGGRAHELQELTFDAWSSAMRQRTLALADRYGKVVLCGFSLGSLIALKLAAERLPAIAGLVVLGNAVKLHAYASLPFALWEALGMRMPDAYFLKVRAADITDAAAAETLTTYDRHPMRAALEVYRAGKRVRAEVDRVTLPTLILHGKRDRVCPVRNAAWLASHVGAKDVTVRVFEKSAHVLAADVERDEVAEEVARFVERISLV